MRRLLACVLLCLSLLPGFGIFITAAQSSSAHKLIELVNEYRASHGVPPLEINNSLMAAAQRHANWMAANYAHSHQGEGGSMPQDRATAAGYQGLVSENVASGTLSYVTPAWAVEGWAGSPGHRRTMLSNNVHVGAGIALNEEEEFYVLVIGSPSEFAPKPPAGAQTAPEEDSEEAEAEPIIVVPIELAEPREDGSVVHVVQQGQTAWAIAARYGVPLDELMAINHLDRNAVLYPGDEIIARLGEGQSPPPPPTLPATHIVQSGQTLWTVAAIYGMTLDELLTLNGLERGAILHPGDELLLRLPDPTPTATPALTATQIALAPSPTSPPSPPAAVVTILSPSPDPTSTPQVTPTLPPTVTLSPAPPAYRNDNDSDFEQTMVIGVVAVGLGIIVMASMAAIIMRRRQE